MSPFRSDEQMAIRDEKCREIEAVFKKAEFGTRHQRLEGMPYSEVAAFFNYGGRRQRRVSVTVDDDGTCRAFLSDVYVLPEGKTGDDVAHGMKLESVGVFASTTPDLGGTILRQVRAAANI